MNKPVKVARIGRKDYARAELPRSMWRMQLRMLAKWMLIVWAVLMASAIVVAAHAKGGGGGGGGGHASSAAHASSGKASTARAAPAAPTKTATSTSIEPPRGWSWWPFGGHASSSKCDRDKQKCSQ